MSQHFGIVRILRETLVDQVRDSKVVSSDAICKGIGYDVLTDSVYVIFEHPDLPEHKETEVIVTIARL